MIQRNPLSQYKNIGAKHSAFIAARRRGEYAYCQDYTRIPLSQVKFGDVEFIGGLWRVQNKLDYNIMRVRDRDLILGPRIDVVEKNYFEYYSAANVPTYNCYGPIHGLEYNMVVAKYTTDRGTYWAYGKTIADARAFLGIKMYDEYMDVIHNMACRNQNKKNK